MKETDTFGEGNDSSLDGMKAGHALITLEDFLNNPDDYLDTSENQEGEKALSKKEIAEGEFVERFTNVSNQTRDRVSENITIGWRQGVRAYESASYDEQKEIRKEIAQFFRGTRESHLSTRKKIAEKISDRDLQDLRVFAQMLMDQNIAWTQDDLDSMLIGPSDIFHLSEKTFLQVVESNIANIQEWTGRLPSTAVPQSMNAEDIQKTVRLEEKDVMLVVQHFIKVDRPVAEDLAALKENPYFTQFKDNKEAQDKIIMAFLKRRAQLLGYLTEKKFSQFILQHTEALESSGFKSLFRSFRRENVGLSNRIQEDSPLCSEEYRGYIDLYVEKRLLSFFEEKKKEQEVSLVKKVSIDKESFVNEKKAKFRNEMLTAFTGFLSSLESKEPLSFKDAIIAFRASDTSNKLGLILRSLSKEDQVSYFVRPLEVWFHNMYTPPKNKQFIRALKYSRDIASMKNLNEKKYIEIGDLASQLVNRYNNSPQSLVDQWYMQEPFSGMVLEMLQKSLEYGIKYKIERPDLVDSSKLRQLIEIIENKG